MALKFYDRTKEEATTTGTGTFSLSGTGADGGFRAFSAVHATGDEVFYCAVDSSNNAFEVGKGTLTSGTPWTLSRAEIKSSSNSNNKVNFASAPEIFSTYPAENAAFFDTDMPNNVVETDAIFTDTLTADKALSGQFKGTLQFNKSYFTSTDYTVAAGQTLTVTDSADLYAVNITTSTTMDRTGDFTSNTTITADTLFSPGINAYATVTINNGITATVSPVGTTFVNNGNGIISDSFQQEGASVKWKLPMADGAPNTEIVTDGVGGLKLKGAASGGGAATPTPTEERLVKVWDYNNYTPAAPVHGFECMVPTSLAASPSEIENFHWKLKFVNFGSTNDTTADYNNMLCYIAPLSTAGGSPILDSTSANYYGYIYYRNSTNTAWTQSYSFQSAKDVTHSGSGVSGGSYACNDYGLNLWGYNSNPQVPSWGTTTYYGPSIANNPFSSTNYTSQRTNLNGNIRIQNTIMSPDCDWELTWSSYQSTYSHRAAQAWGTMMNQPNNSNTINRVTNNHAQGIKLWFLPNNVSNLSGTNITGVVSGRIECWVTLKQSAAELAVA